MRRPPKETKTFQGIVCILTMYRIRYLKGVHAPALLEMARMVWAGLISINTTDSPALRRHMLHTDHKIPLSQAPCLSDW